MYCNAMYCPGGDASGLTPLRSLSRLKLDCRARKKMLADSLRAPCPSNSQAGTGTGRVFPYFAHTKIDSLLEETEQEVLSSARRGMAAA